MYTIAVRKHLDKKFLRFRKRNPSLLSAIDKKISEIASNPHHFKNLEAPKQHLKRVHIGDKFVLLFSVDETNKMVILEDFEHHDVVYG
jgi:YafQ family addiction module toxin component